jgi:formamidopyrimidine-DNA glycosylase
MPELPEVESIRMQLERFLVGLPRGGALRGHTIKKIEIRNPKYEIKEKDKIQNAKITGVRRFGKALVIDLSNGYSIVVHVKMTGQFIYQGPNLHHSAQGSAGLSKKVVGGVPGKHTHVIFTLDHSGVLYFNDYRRFGWMKLEKTPELQNSKNPNSYIGKLGHEFLKDLRLEEFSEILSKSKKPIKVLLMDQEKMAGVGNIYANDALWFARINPMRTSKNLRKEEMKKLYTAIETVLKEGIKRGGASEQAFVTPDGSEGKYQDFTLVYGREGQPCKECKTAIKKIKLGSRGTYFCPRCQV